ncbi:hypothetical protein [Streptomyces sp. BE230]|uniref:hypothetical protein n=1 Tax=Streptomyces sp. BE230 TaxID=3002526 RepID=UPI002ED2A403|nr:hypothetical protein [Streptomyces sp. BE230]
MPQSRSRAAHAVSVAALSAALLTACSSSPTPAAPPETARVTPTAPASAHPSAPSPLSTSTDLSDWPSAPATRDKIPQGRRAVPLASGYTGRAFLDRLAKTWHIAMRPREKVDVRAGDAAPPVWHSAGTSAGGSALTVAAVWTLSGDLDSVTCTAPKKAPGRARFLRDCAGLDHPGADPKAAAAWLDGMTPRVDTAYEKAGAVVESPLYRSGPAATYLRAYPLPGKEPAYLVYVFGTGETAGATH